MRSKFLPEFRLSCSLGSVKPSGGFSVNALGYMKKEFLQECREFLWCPRGNMRTLDANERMGNEDGGRNHHADSCSLLRFLFKVRSKSV